MCKGFLAKTMDGTKPTHVLRQNAPQGSLVRPFHGRTCCGSALLRRPLSSYIRGAKRNSRAYQHQATSRMTLILLIGIARAIYTGGPSRAVKWGWWFALALSITSYAFAQPQQQMA